MNTDTRMQGPDLGRSMGIDSSPPGGADWIDSRLVDDVRDYLLENPGPVTTSAVATALQRTGRVMGTAAVLELVGRISAQLSGAGPLQPLLDRPGVTDVFVNGPQSVWADFGRGLEPIAMSLGTESDVRALAVRLAALGGRRLDDASPLVDVRLPDGVRLNAVLPPLSGDVTVLSFRIPRTRAFTLEELVAGGSVDPEIADLLLEMLATRVNFLISGGTGSGKTALLGALLAQVEPGMRIVIVEDSRELAVDHPHVVQLSARQANIEGAGLVTMADLVRNALRMRPDRLVVGECRGAEVRDMLTALNTGHEGGCATLHANTADSVPIRLEALGALAGMTPTAVHSQMSTAIDAVVHVRRLPAGRAVDQLAAPVRHGSGPPEMRTLWTREDGFVDGGKKALRDAMSARGRG